jgi:hypothetical protein
MVRAILTTALTALIVVPAVAAHGDGGALGFRSSVTATVPVTAGVEAVVLDSDDRLQLTNDSGKTVAISGYEGEPYLEFRDGRVFRNALSPATYLNDERFGDVEVPDEADPKAPPRWEEVAPRERYDWHDHRIHWMSRELPPKVEATKDQAQHVFDWKVPGTIDGEPFAIEGSLDYSPPPSGNPLGLALGFAAAIGVVALIVVILRLRRSQGSA